MKRELKLVILAVIASVFIKCSGSDKEIKWNIEGLFEVKSIKDTKYNDTLEVRFIDQSYIWFDDYCSWKTDYLVFKNKNNFTDNKVFRFVSEQEGRKDKVFYYSKLKIDSVLGVFENSK